MHLRIKGCAIEVQENTIAIAINIIMDVFKVQQQISPLQLAKLEQNKRQRVRNNLPAARKENNSNDNKSDW